MNQLKSAWRLLKSTLRHARYGDTRSRFLLLAEISEFLFRKSPQDQQLLGAALSSRELRGCFLGSEADGFKSLRQFARALCPPYRFSFPTISWWRDELFNGYLDAFGERDGLNVARRWTLLQLARLASTVPGDTAECGVYKGAGSWLICAAMQRTGKHHFGFDSFAGLSQPVKVDGEYWTRGDLTADEVTARENLRQFAGVSLYPGWIPDRFAEIESKSFSFLHIDVDLYEPTKDSLEFFYPRMEEGGIVLCDDFGFETCPGATMAVQEYLADKVETMLPLADGGGFFIKGKSVNSADLPVFATKCAASALEIATNG